MAYKPNTTKRTGSKTGSAGQSFSEDANTQGPNKTTQLEMTEEKENREQEYDEELFHNPNADVNVQNNAEARRSSMPEMQTTRMECPISATVFEPPVMTVGLPTVNELQITQSVTSIETPIKLITIHKEVPALSQNEAATAEKHIQGKEGSTEEMKNTGSTTVNDILQQGAETNLPVPPLLQIDDPQQRAIQKLTQAEENTKIRNHKREEADQNTEKIAWRLSDLALTKQVPRAILETPITEQSKRMQKPKDKISKEDAKEVLITPVKENKGNKAVGKENESVHTSKRKSERIASRPKSNPTMQEQATRLLMKKCGIVDTNKNLEQGQ